MFKETKSFFIVFFIISLILAFFPIADIWFSNFFYEGEKQFLVKHYLVGQDYYYEFIIRRFLLPAIILFSLFFPFFTKTLNLVFPKVQFFIFSFKEIFYIWFSAIFISTFINSGLKENWGRARPNDILYFGGDGNFTSWITYTNECISNCSFVSGDASVGFFIAIFYYITKKIKFFYLSIFLGLFFGLARIGAGAHFLSDVLMSFIFVNFGLLISRYIYYQLIKWIKA